MYWLTLFMCIAVPNQPPQCEPRMWPKPFAEHQQCMMAAGYLIKHLPELTFPALCGLAKPQVPVLTAGPPEIDA